ncbi:MAG: V-type ATP synthase subunit E [Prevotella sp.]|nr:V-type ATP synthase subunit E [Prevotella sp.]
MTEQDLTKKILRNANQQAKDLLATAQAQADAKIAEAQAQATVRKNTALKKAKADLAYRQTQQKRAYEVAQIKAQINAQQQWIDQAFNQTREKLLHATKTEIQRLVDAYTQKYAQPGDKIVVAQAWAHALPQLPITDTIAGGIIIENPTYRLELDVDSVLNALREPLAPSVAEILGVI